MPQKRMDLSGQKFGSLTAISINRIDKGGNSIWNCECECGGISTVRGGHLKSGQTKSCGGKGRGCRRVFRDDLTGQTFGRLTVIRRNGYANYTGQRYQKWDCVCSCGELRNVIGVAIRSGATKSCGCLRAEKLLASHTTHGMCGTPEYQLFHRAKRRAKKIGIPFSLELSDINIPKSCPLLGIDLANGKKTMRPNSPSLDRIIPSLGYVKSNVWVISQKANQLKSDLTPDQFRKFLEVIESTLEALAGDTENA